MNDKLPVKWNKDTVENIIESISLANKKIKKQNYQETGKIPIIDQGKQLIGGYTDREECKITVKLPLIIFGDHTRAIKYIDFDFAPGADGIKVMKIDEKIIPKYFYYFLKSINIENKGYSRHFKILKEQQINFPEDKNIQKKMIQKLDDIFEQFNQKRKNILEIKRKNQNRIKGFYKEVDGEIITTYFESLEVKRESDFRKLSDACIINPSKSELQDIDENTKVSFIPMKAVSGVEGIIQNPEIRLFKDVKNGYTYFRENDVIFAKITPCMENGKSAVGKNLINKIGFGSTEFHVLRPNDDVLPEWIYYFIRQNKFRKEAEHVMSGSAGQQRVPLSFFDSYIIPVPSISLQKKIIKKLNKSKKVVQTFQDNLKPLMSNLESTEEYFSKLQNSILQQTFLGKLLD